MLDRLLSHLKIEKAREPCTRCRRQILRYDFCHYRHTFELPCLVMKPNRKSAPLGGHPASSVSRKTSYWL